MAKGGQARPNRAKWGQTGPNDAKQGQMGLIFCMHTYFYERKKIMFSNPGPQTKIGRAMGILFDVVVFLVLVRQFLARATEGTSLYVLLRQSVS